MLSIPFLTAFAPPLQISIIGVFRTQPLYNACVTKWTWVLVPIARASPTPVIRFATHVAGFWPIFVQISLLWSNNFIEVV